MFYWSRRPRAILMLLCKFVCDGLLRSASALRFFSSRCFHGNALNRWGITTFLSCFTSLFIRLFLHRACNFCMRTGKSGGENRLSCRILRLHEAHGIILHSNILVNQSTKVWTKVRSIPVQCNVNDMESRTISSRKNSREKFSLYNRDCAIN